MRLLSVLSGTLLLLSIPSTEAAAATLLVGDSHSVLDFGSELARGLGAGTLRYAVAGASARTWLSDPVCGSGRCPYTYGYATPDGPRNGRLPQDFPGLRSLLQENSPARIVIALGTNDANNLCRQAGQPGAMGGIRQLLALLRPGQSCVWIGPPGYRQGSIYEHCGASYERFVDQLAATVQGRCRFVDSRGILDPATGEPVEADAGDRVHFTRRTALIWARGAATLALRQPAGGGSTATSGRPTRGR